MSSSINTSTVRLTFIDLARTYAVLLALLAHVLSTLGVFNTLGSKSIYIMQFTRMATPMFVFMFGFMMQFVYLKRVKENKTEHVFNRLFIRSFQCYLAYALICLCAYLGDYQSLKDSIKSLLFLSDSRFGNILRTYSVMLIVTPFIIRLKLLYGCNFLYLLLLSLLFYHAFLPNFQEFNIGIGSKTLNILFGVSDQLGGPSVIGAFIFYISGMIIASSLEKYNLNKSFRDFYKSVALLTAVVLIGCFSLIPDSPIQAWMYFADYTYRRLNAPGYYLIGTLCSLLIILLISLAAGNIKIRKPFLYIIPIGTSSLTSYTVGNVILNLFGGVIQGINIFLFIPTFFLLVLIITTQIHKAPFYSKIQATFTSLFSRIFLRTIR